MNLNQYFLITALIFGQGTLAPQRSVRASSPVGDNITLAVKHLHEYLEGYKTVLKAEDIFKQKHDTNTFKNAIDKLGEATQLLKKLELPEDADDLRVVINRLNEATREVDLKSKALAAAQEGVADVLQKSGGFGLFRNNLGSLWLDLEEAKVALNEVRAAATSKQREAFNRLEAKGEVHHLEITPMQRDALLAQLAVMLQPDNSQSAPVGTPSSGSPPPPVQPRPNSLPQNILTPEMKQRLEQEAKDRQEVTNRENSDSRYMAHDGKARNAQTRENTMDRAVGDAKGSQLQMQQTQHLLLQLAKENERELRDRIGQAQTGSGAVSGASQKRFQEIMQDARKQNAQARKNLLSGDADGKGTGPPQASTQFEKASAGNSSRVAGDKGVDASSKTEKPRAETASLTRPLTDTEAIKRGQRFKRYEFVTDDPSIDESTMRRIVLQMVLEDIEKLEEGPSEGLQILEEPESVPLP